MATPIPAPPALPFLGNINDIDPVNSLADLYRLADTYGPIFKLQLGGQARIFISTHALLDEVCDEKRWQKQVSAFLNELRNAVGDGLFTAFNGEHNWEVAHRVLMPAFGPIKMRDMFDEMHDIASQLVIKWARFGPTPKIKVTDDFTRLTLDSIALCAMGVRFNSFYKDDMHPFVDAMTGVLLESGPRARRPAFASYFMRAVNQKWESDIDLMKTTAAEMLAERLKHPSNKPDLLNAMINGRDPKTGEGLSETSIMNNMVTFLIAGHETTSGMLSFLFYYLLKNPAAYQAAQKEVDDIVGRGPVTVDHMSRLPYLSACLRETLRLKPTAAAFTLTPRPEVEEPVLLGGKYEIPKETPVMALLEKIHSDPTVWGDDAAEYKPERMLDEPFSKLPKNAWKPFGNGVRGCIGRAFAWQEALLTTTLLLQNFNFRFNDPGYNLAIKQTLTIKPESFFMHATLREGLDVVHLEKTLHIDTSREGKMAMTEQSRKEDVTHDSKKPPMSILYGSNSGTCEALARSLGRTATGRGFQVSIDPLDSAVGVVPKGQPVLMITSSYEGQPPDNAAHFVEWLASLQGKELKGVEYAVYGCGNRDWVSTFHKVPKAIDSLFSSNGATRFADLGLGDVAAGDIFNEFDLWQDKILWPALGGDEGDETGFEVEINTTSRPSTLRQDVEEAIVISNEVLTSGVETEKRHIKLKLPTGTSYQVGDYIAVLPLNNSQTVRRVLKRFGLPWDSMLKIKSGNTTLPTHQVSAADIFGAYVELSQPATRKNVSRISASIADEKMRNQVSLLASDQFEAEIAAKRRSPLDLLEEYPSAQLPLGEFLAMLPPMRIRQYSISSSPLSDPTTASLTWSVLDAPSKAGGQRFLGVASTYLSNVEAGDRIHIAIKPSHGNFHLPTAVESTPIIMLCAGTGVAPFRGYVQERAMQIAAGRELAAAYLFIGCSHPDRDELFKSEFAEWESIGAVKTFYAYSKAKEQSQGCRYVQDRLWEEREAMAKVFDEGAKLYVCGSAMVGEAVAHTIKRIYFEAAEASGKEKSEEEAQAWFEGIKSDRYASDVFTA